MAGRWSNDFETAKKHIIGDVSRLILVAEKLVKLDNRLNGKRQGPLRELVGRLEEIQNLVGQSHMKVVFFGSTSNGKSTLINALLGGKVLPTGCGSVSSCFCSIQGKTGPKGSAKIGSRTYDNLETAASLANCLSENSLGVEDWLEIHWPTQKCALLEAEVMLIDSPGLGVDDYDDQVFEKYCRDSDLFVYICHGMATLKRAELEFIANVNKHLSKPNNFLIVVNHWDSVVRDDPGKVELVRKQHTKRASAFLKDHLKIRPGAMSQHLFFVSAKEAVAISDQSRVKPETPRKNYPKLLRLEEKWEEREKEFKRFEESLKVRLTQSAIETKFGRHCEKCLKHVDTIASEPIAEISKSIEKQKEEMAREVNAVRRKILQLESGGDGFITQYDIKTESFLDKTREKVAEAVDEVKRKMREVISTNTIVVQTETVSSYVWDVCALIETEVHVIERNLAAELNREYQMFLKGKKELMKRSFRDQCGYSTHPSVSTGSMQTLPSFVECSVLIGGYIPEYSWQEHINANNTPDVGVGTAAATAGSFALLRLGGSSTLSAGALALFGGYAAYKAVRWFGSDDWKRGLNKKLCEKLSTGLEETVNNLRRSCVSAVESSLNEARKEFESAFSRAIRKEKQVLSAKEADLRQWEKEQRAELESAQSELSALRESFEEFTRKYLQHQFDPE
jgi:GTPase SAR1 family protein